MTIEIKEVNPMNGTHKHAKKRGRLVYKRFKSIMFKLETLLDTHRGPPSYRPEHTYVYFIIIYMLVAFPPMVLCAPLSRSLRASSGIHLTRCYGIGLCSNHTPVVRSRRGSY